MSFVQPLASGHYALFFSRHGKRLLHLLYMRRARKSTANAAMPRLSRVRASHALQQKGVTSNGDV